MTHARVEEMLGLYALGTLDADDVAAVDAHLARCALCAGELASLERTVATLAHAPAPLAPSPETSRRILALPASAPRLRMIPPRAAPPRRRRLLSLLTRGAVAAVLALLVVSNLELVRRLDRARRLQRAIAFMAGPDVATIPLRPLDAAPRARVLVAYDRRSGRGVFFATDLPPPPPGHRYQLWTIAEALRPAAVFSADAFGVALARAGGSSAVGVPLFAITLEPSAGGDEPTGRFLFLGGAPQSTSAETTMSESRDTRSMW